MSRPLRIEYPGAWYHIMNRGGRYEAIFEDKNDYSVFLELLRETIEIFHIKDKQFRNKVARIKKIANKS
jgi:hypothetical protein